MKLNEKTLLENLFDRLKDTEKQFPDRNKEAEDLINNFLKQYPNSPYYIIQTVLVQESVINNLNDKVIKLEKDIKNMNKNIKKPGFLSNFFKKCSGGDKDNSTPKSFIRGSSDLNDSRKSNPNYNMNNTNPNYNYSNPNNSVSGGGVSSFLGNVAQTAAGVAGGVVLGNIISNAFQSDKHTDFNHHDDTVNSSTEFHPDNSDFESEENTRYTEEEIFETEDNDNYNMNDENSFENFSDDDMQDDEFI
ncbi:DUF2076 domain-containing protein [Buchnera aphidicola (Kurisakia onigurumii)]|uniref:DUF2076 domain-containing protein n=1 Tax=Buchnera aphidicola TaxID=9 RepID=UPI0031B69F0C